MPPLWLLRRPRLRPPPGSRRGPPVRNPLPPVAGTCRDLPTATLASVTEPVFQDDRRAAALAVMKVSHPDIYKFIDAKTEQGILNNFNISVGVTEEFLDAVETNSQWELRFNRKVYQTVRARDLWNKMMSNAVKYAEPGLINWDLMRSNNSYYFDPIVAPNPCGEAPMGNNGSCCLGSLVLPKFIIPVILKQQF